MNVTCATHGVRNTHLKVSRCGINKLHHSAAHISNVWSYSNTKPEQHRAKTEGCRAYLRNKQVTEEQVRNSSEKLQMNHNVMKCDFRLHVQMQFLHHSSFELTTSWTKGLQFIWLCHSLDVFSAACIDTGQSPKVLKWEHRAGKTELQSIGEAD